MGIRLNLLSLSLPTSLPLSLHLTLLIQNKNVNISIKACYRHYYSAILPFLWHTPSQFKYSQSSHSWMRCWVFPSINEVDSIKIGWKRIKRRKNSWNILKEVWATSSHHKKLKLTICSLSPKLTSSEYSIVLL